MKWFTPDRSLRRFRQLGRLSVHAVSGRLIMELGCWIVGVTLIVAYLVATTSLESQRSEGIALFYETRAEASRTPAVETLPRPDRAALPWVNPADQESASAAPAVETQRLVETLPIAVLRLASVGLEVPVYADASELNLSRGAGWIDGTAAPNQGGNLGLAAHRDRYFRPLKDVEVGDLLELESLDGVEQFRVSRIVIVNPDEISVLDDTAVPTITLVTCYPFYLIGHAPQRFIVQATAVETSGQPSVAEVWPTALSTGESP